MSDDQAAAAADRRVECPVCRAVGRGAEVHGVVDSPEGAIPCPRATRAAACAAPATVLVMRGRRRLWLCDEHRGTYTGSGRVAPYRGTSMFDRPEDPPAGVFTGPPRRCGEEQEA